MGYGLIDELGDENNSSDDTGDKADGTNNDVEVGQAHGGAVAEEAEEDDQEDSNTNNKMDCDKAHT